MNELVQRLANGTHPIDFETRTKGLNEIKERLDNGFVFVTFTQTKGGTELGINIENALTNLSMADFKEGSGIIHVSGTCTLNYQKVRCTADIDLATLKGSGNLIPLDEAGTPIKADGCH
jgi:hypothetical protein